MPAEGSAVVRTAVIVIGGGGIDPRVVAHLPADRMVIAADSGLDHAMELGLEVDLLVGDLDSVSPPALAEAIARGTPVERHRPDKDATDTELALAAAVERGCTHLIGVGGPRPDDSRLDHELGVLLAFAAPALAGREVELWWGPARVLVLHGPGAAPIDAPLGAIISLLPLHGPATGVTTTGLRYPLRAEPLIPGSGRGISNEVDAAASVSVHLEAGTLLVVDPLALGGTPCTDA
jgi:thiamine pyrophosphokinase